MEKQESSKKMFKWETPTEYAWRNETGKIATRISKALYSMEKIVASGSLDYSEVKKEIDNCNKRVKYLVVPSMYEDAHVFLFEAVKAYSRAMEILVIAAKVKDKKAIIKAGRLINEGNSFISITKSRVFESIEAKEDEWTASNLFRDK